MARNISRRDFSALLMALPSLLPSRPVFAQSGQQDSYPAACQAALDNLDRWITRKFHHMGIEPRSPAALLGPTMDVGTYYYRIGDKRRDKHNPNELTLAIYDGGGMDEDDLEKASSQLVKLGFPKINLHELHTINSQFYTTLKTQYPDRQFVVKHFPGGDERIETTEHQPIHFRKNEPIADWIKGFDVAIKEKPAWGVMLGHASYDLSAFPGIEGMKPPVIPKQFSDIVRAAYNMPTEPLQDVFSNVPASMNPFITRYLRDVKGYKGVIVSDWFEMGGSNAFCYKVEPYLSSLANSKGSAIDISFMMAAVAGVNYPRPFSMVSMTKEFWTGLRENSPDFFNRFDDQLNATIASTYQALRQSTDPTVTFEDIKKLSFEQKVDLLSCRKRAVDGHGDAINESMPALEKAHKAFPVPILYEVINMRTQVVMNDIWSRGGIMVMQYRKSVVEHLGNAKFPDAPMDSLKEPSWFEGLMQNRKFRAIYDKVDWDVMAKASDGAVFQQKSPEKVINLPKPHP